MADLTVTFASVSLPAATSATLTVYEDVGGDGSASNSVTVGGNTIQYDNSASVSLADGQTEYTLSGFDGASGNDVYVRVEPSTTDITKTAEIGEVTDVSPPSSLSNLTVTLASVSLPASTSATLTVYEDVGGDGSGPSTVTVGGSTIQYENSASTALSNDQTEYIVSGFDGASGNDVYVRIEPGTGDVTRTAEIGEVTDVSVTDAADGLTYDFDVDTHRAAHESVANTDHDDANTIVRGYDYTTLQSEYPILYGSNLVGWWPLNGQSGSATDVAGPNDGSISDSPARGVAGVGGLSAMAFEPNTQDRVEAPSDLHVGDTFTLAAWVKADSLQNGEYGQHIARKGGGSWEFIFRAPDNADEIQAFINSTSGTLNEVTFPFSRTDEWVHLAFVCDDANSEIRLYEDGVLQGTKSKTITVRQDNTEPFCIGGEPGGAGDPWDGPIADFRYYNAALTGSELGTLYEFGSKEWADPPGQDDGGVAYLPFDDGTANDVWGSNDGTVNGPTYVSDGGIVGGAYSFSNGDITIPDPFDSDADFSMSAWYKTSGTSREQIFWKRDNSDFDGPILGVNQQGGSSTDGYLTFGTSDGSTYVAVTDNTVDWSNGEWVHVVMTWNESAGEIRGYANGQLLGVSSASLGTTTNVDLVIGNRDDGVYPFSGEIDEVRLYNRTIEPWEVFELYRYGAPGHDLREHLVRYR